MKQIHFIYFTFHFLDTNNSIKMYLNFFTHICEDQNFKNFFFPISRKIKTINFYKNRERWKTKNLFKKIHDISSIFI